MRELLQIGEVAQLVGVSTKTIRYYHEIDLLPEPERTASRYRLYTVQHLQRLRRICRLRALGLPLGRIREVLDESPESNESTLRAALHSLVEEISAQMLELEQRRTLLQQLLSGKQLESVDENAYFFYSPELKTQLMPHLAHLSAESLEWGQRIDAMLGSFNWPTEYRQGFQNSLQHVVDHAEHYRHLFALEERLAALVNLAADDPEIEQLADEYVQSQELASLYQQLLQAGIGEESPFASALSGLMSGMVAPAQQRFFDLLRQKASALAVDRSSSTVTSKTEQEQ